MPNSKAVEFSWWIIRYAGGGLLSYAAPRVLVAAGVPIDQWTVAMGGWLSIHIDRELALWIITFVIGAALYFSPSLWAAYQGHPARAVSLPAFRKPKPMIIAGVLIIVVGVVVLFIGLHEASLNKYIKPRMLTGAQAETIRSYLLPHDHFRADVYFYYPDSETEEFATQIMNALHAAGWDSERRAATDGKLPTGEILVQGISLKMAYGKNYPGGTAKKVRLIEEAFTKAHLVIGSSYGSHNLPNVAEGDVELMILVGRRPVVVE